MGALKPRLRVEYSAVTHLSSNSLAKLIFSINLDGLAMLKPTIVPARWTFFMAIIVLLSACGDVDNTASDISTRWYTTEQLAQGKVLFSDNCAACHGFNGEGAANWQNLDKNGFYPAPPINGSAHAWHHSLKVLLSTINAGGKPLGGSMPAFQNLLTVDEQRSVIAAFQDYWPDDTYAQWRVIDLR